MNYIESTLLSDENLIYYSRPHWVVFTPAVVMFLMAALLLWYGPRLGLAGFHILNLDTYEFAALIAFVAGLFAFFKAWINLKTSEYGITDKRVLMKVGFIQRSSLEIFLDRIEAVLVDQTITGRLLNYGTIVIVGTGGTRDPFYNVPDPMNFRKTVQQQIAMAKQLP
jgi:uncharacterized membrane protein YdbT with pleckstrin-like domain